MRTTRYWIGTISGLVTPLYALVLVVSIYNYWEFALFLAFFGGLLIIPAVIAELIWSISFLTKYIDKQLDAKNYRFPIILMFLNLILFIGPMIMKLRFFMG